MADLISVIVSTYNRPDALSAVLRSLSRQGDRGFEVIVADDGSEPDTSALVDRWQPRLGVPLRHVWHEHRGFRAGEIRNRAVRVSTGPHCLFLDGDCLAPFDFVAAHRRLAEQGWFVTGNRAMLSPAMTEAVLGQGLEPEQWSLAAWAGQRLRGRINRLSPLVRLPAGPLRKLRPRAWAGARSCNLAVWRADLDRVDGFDTSYAGWGREDSDLLIRLIRAGVGRKDGNFATGVIHLWHPEADRAGLADNENRLAQVIASERVRAVCGMSGFDRDDALGAALLQADR